MNKRILMENGEEVIYNGEAKRALISDAGDLTNYYDDRIIETDFSFDTGNIFEYQGYKWLVISQVRHNKEGYKGKIRRSNYSVKFVIEHKLYEFDAIIDGMSYSIQSNPIISTLEGDVEVILPSDENSDKIATKMRFIKMGNAFEVTGSDKTKLGLVILKCELDSFRAGEDDKENEIANADQITDDNNDDNNNGDNDNDGDNDTPKYYIVFTSEYFEGTSDSIIYTKEEYPIVTKLYDENDNLVDPQPQMTYSVDKESLVTSMKTEGNTLYIKLKYSSSDRKITITATGGTTTVSKTFTIDL